MTLFDTRSWGKYLTALQVKKSVYDHVVYESEVERKFARRLDERDDIRLFVKLPSWFKIESRLLTADGAVTVIKMST